MDPIKNTQLVTVSFESPDANLAAEVANAVADGYVKYNVDMKHRTAEEAGAWLQQQVGGLVAKADRATAALQAYQTKADLLGIQEQRQIVTQKLLAQDRAHLDSQTQRQTAEAKLREITRILKDPVAADAMFTVIDDPMIRKLKNEQSDLLAERAKLRELYSPTHPDRVTIEAQVKFVNERIREEAGRAPPGRGERVSAGQGARGKHGGRPQRAASGRAAAGVQGSPGADAAARKRVQRRARLLPS